MRSKAITKAITLTIIDGLHEAITLNHAIFISAGQAITQANTANMPNQSRLGGSLQGTPHRAGDEIEHRNQTTENDTRRLGSRIWNRPIRRHPNPPKIEKGANK